MATGSIVFLTPLAWLLALLALVPLGAFALAERRLRAARGELGLAAPARGPRFRRAIALASVPLLLAAAAAQPALRSQSSARARTDAAAFVVLDVSRSMAAAPGPAAATRLARARAIADDLSSDVGTVPLGVATLTDRVLPDLFPTADRATFRAVVDAVRLEDPPPRETSVTATAFGALGSLGSQGFFGRTIRHRVLVLVTDGESRPFDAAAVASSLGAGPGVSVVITRVGDGRDRIAGRQGTPEPYRPDPAGAAASVAQLARATHGVVAGSAPAAAAAVRRAVGSGPTVAVGLDPTIDTLAPYIALLALIPLLTALWPEVIGSVPVLGRSREGT